MNGASRMSLIVEDIYGLLESLLRGQLWTPEITSQRTKYGPLEITLMKTILKASVKNSIEDILNRAQEVTLCGQFMGS